MKLIKFDLPIDGVKIKNIEELRDHFTIEILDHYRSGLLSKWMRSRNMTGELAALASLEGLSENALLKSLCNIFDVEVDDSIISALFDEMAVSSAKSTVNIVNAYDVLAESIDFYIFQALRMNLIVMPDDGVFNLPSANTVLKKGEVLISVDDLKILTNAAGEVYLTIYKGAHKKYKGEVVGMYSMSLFMEDMDHDFMLNTIFLNARYTIINAFANTPDTSPLLRDALLQRAEVIKSIFLVLIDEYNKNIKISTAEAVKALSAEQLNCVWLKNAT